MIWKYRWYGKKEEIGENNKDKIEGNYDDEYGEYEVYNKDEIEGYNEDEWIEYGVYNKMKWKDIMMMNWIMM